MRPGRKALEALGPHKAAAGTQAPSTPALNTVHDVTKPWAPRTGNTKDRRIQGPEVDLVGAPLLGGEG